VLLTHRAVTEVAAGVEHLALPGANLALGHAVGQGERGGVQDGERREQQE
jgi:hypothetical protein